MNYLYMGPSHMPCKFECHPFEKLSIQHLQSPVPGPELCHSYCRPLSGGIAYATRFQRQTASDGCMLLCAAFPPVDAIKIVDSAKGFTLVPKDR